MGEVMFHNAKCYDTFMADTAFDNVKCYHTFIGDMVFHNIKWHPTLLDDTALAMHTRFRDTVLRNAKCYAVMRDVISISVANRMLSVCRNAKRYPTLMAHV